MRKSEIEGNGFKVYATYYKTVIDLRIMLYGGHGNTVNVPDLGIDTNVLRSIRLGWRASDSSYRDREYKDKHYEYPTMTTHHPWQVILWLISIPSEANIYIEGIFVSRDGIKPRWLLTINNFAVEWHSAEEAYREMLELPSNLFAISLLHAILGDGRNESTRHRLIELANKNRDILELIRSKLENEFNIKGGSIYPIKGASVWSYAITGESAKKLAELFVSIMDREIPQIKRLYDILTEDFTLIKLMKWAHIVRIGRYRSGLLKIRFGGLWWTPNFTTVIRLVIVSKDIDYVEEVTKRMKAQGIHAIVKKSVGEGYSVWIEWSELKEHLCDSTLRKELIRAAELNIKNCKLKNMEGRKRRRDCSKIPSAKWIKRLTDLEWLKENLKCFDDNNPA